MVYLQYHGYSLEEVNDHWLKQGLPKILADLSKRCSKLKSKEMPKQNQALKTDDILKNGHKNGSEVTDYYLYVLDRMSITIA